MEPLVIAGRAFKSRLIVGTGKYKDGPQTRAAIEASGAEMVTVAVRRVNLDRTSESLLDFIDPKRFFLLPNTAGCFTADEAIRAARLGREVGLSDWVKIEVIGDKATLYPDIQATLEATRVLVKEGFTVLPYTSDDIVYARRLIDAGAAAVMPLGAPIGSGLGLQNTANLRILRELITRSSTDRRRRRRHRVGRDAGDGTRLRRRPDEHRHRRRARPHPHGRSDEARSPRRPQGLPLRPHGQAPLRHCQLPAGRHQQVGLNLYGDDLFNRMIPGRRSKRPDTFGENARTQAHSGPNRAETSPVGRGRQLRAIVQRSSSQDAGWSIQ